MPPNHYSLVQTAMLRAEEEFCFSSLRVKLLVMGIWLVQCICDPSIASCWLSGPWIRGWQEAASRVLCLPSTSLVLHPPRATSVMCYGQTCSGITWDAGSLRSSCTDLVGNFSDAHRVAAPRHGQSDHLTISM